MKRILSFVIFGAAIGGVWYYQQAQIKRLEHWIEERIRRVEMAKVAAPEQPAPQVPVVGEGAFGDGTRTEAWAKIQQRAQDTVVQIFSQAADFDWLQPFRAPAQGQALGSGFFISDDGEIVTNAHVVSLAKSVWIQIPSLGKRIIDVDIVGYCPERDLALLRLTPESLELVRGELGKVPTLLLGDSDQVRRSHEILALGYPLGQHALKSTNGVVSGREHTSSQFLIQISAPINPGSSGGPALNGAGEVIGVSSSGFTAAQNVGYIIPINEIRLILDDLRTVKLVRRPFLGVLFTNASEDLTRYLGNPKPGGCYVVEVYKGGPLDKIGVEPEDMIYEINGIPVDIYGEMNVDWSEDKVSIIDYVNRMSLGDQVTVVVYRKGERKEFSFEFSQTDLLPIRTFYPDYEPVSYEIIAGMVIMELAMNHLAQISKIPPHLVKYTETKQQQESVLIVTHIFPNSQAHRSRAMTLASILTEVNGEKVKTLEELKRAILAHKNDEFMTFKNSYDIFVCFSTQKVLNEELRLARDYQYQPTSIMRELLSDPAGRPVQV